MKMNPLDIVGQEFTSQHGEVYTVLKYLSKVNASHKYIIEFKKTKNQKEYPRTVIRNGNVTDVWKKEIVKKNKEVKLTERKTSMNKDYGCLANGKMNLSLPTLILDQATKVAGYCIFDNKKLVKYGTIKSYYENINDRINEIVNNVEKIIIDQKIKNIVFEDIYLDKNLIVFKHLALLLGALLYLSTKHKLTYTTINILEWKTKYNLQKLGSRDLGKTLSKKIVLDNMGIDICDDVSDSILIAYYIMEKDITAEEYSWD